MKGLFGDQFSMTSMVFEGKFKSVKLATLHVKCLSYILQNRRNFKNHFSLQNPTNLTIFEFWKWNIVSPWGVDFLIVWIAQSDVWFFGLAGCLQTLENKAFGNFEKEIIIKWKIMNNKIRQIHGSWLSSTCAKPLPPMANFFTIWGDGVRVIIGSFWPWSRAMVIHSKDSIHFNKKEVASQGQ